MSGRRPARDPVLIGFAESLAAIECAWILLDAGYDIVAFTRRGRRPPLARSRRVDVREVTSPQLDAAAAVADIGVLAGSVGASVVMPLDDDAVWLCDQTAASQPGSDVQVAGPIGPHATLALDKRLQLDVAASAGLRVPPTVVIEPGGRARVPDTPAPWIVKPALAAVAQDGRLRRGKANTAHCESDVAALIADAAEPLLVQPRLIGTGEGVFGLAASGGVVGWSAHRRIRMMNPAGSGSSACLSIDVDPRLRDGSQLFVELADWRTLFMLEFLRTVDGIPWFMELNGRPWGSMVLARHRGLPYPAWAVQVALDPQLRPNEPQPAAHVTARHLGRELLHVAFVARSGSTLPDSQRPGLLRTVRSVAAWHRGERWYNVRRGEFRVFMADTWQAISRVARARRNDR